MQESDAIHLVCYMVLEHSGACVLHKFWNYHDSTTSPLCENLITLSLSLRELTLSVFKLRWNLGNSSTSGCLTSQLDIILVLHL